MRVHVDLDRCRNHGLCAFDAPEVFSFDDEEVLHHVPEPAPEHREAVAYAARGCPVQAITLVE
ncbi:MAG TPA: ferredoxin [Thermobifida alba]|nr:ferredoxin [Thermobifida alba]